MSLEVLNRQLNVVSSLQEGERLSLTLRGSLRKMASPIQVNKLFYSIYREITFQSEQRSLKVTASHIASLEKILQVTRTPSHTELEELVQAENNLTLLVNQGYENYKKTLSSGAPWLFKKDHAKCLQEVDAQITRIKSLLLLLRQRIAFCQKELQKGDTAHIDDLFKGKRIKPLLVRQTFFDRLVSKFGADAAKQVFRSYSLTGKTILKGHEVHALLAGLYASRLRGHYE